MSFMRSKFQLFALLSLLNLENEVFEIKTVVDRYERHFGTDRKLK